jgi:ABC-2 type transport system ATP-binding protein
MAATAPALVLDGVVLDRGGRRVLDGLSLRIAQGEVYALLGSNGAGKSTTLAAILGLLEPQAGSISVGSFSVSGDRDRVRRSIAFLPESVALYEHLTATENVRYFLELAGEARSGVEIEAAFATVGLQPEAWTRRTDSFSKGMRQKTAIALALLRRAPVLLLDEPTSGLDPVATRDFHRIAGDLRDRGVAILMVTHDLLGAADVADRIGLLDRGRIDAEWSAGSGTERFDVAALHRSFARVSAA